MTKSFLHHLSSATWLFYWKACTFTTPIHVNFCETWHCGYQSDFVQVLVLIKFCLIKNIYSKSSKKSEHLFCFYKMLINAVAAPEHVVKVVPEVLYIATIDSLIQQFYPRMWQVGRDRKISDSHRKRYSCPLCDSTPKYEYSTYIKIHFQDNTVKILFGHPKILL